VAERAGLLNRYTSLNLYRGFESLPLRKKKDAPQGAFFFPEREKLAFQNEENKNAVARRVASFFF
jgi:hypothetical protein